MTMSAHQSKVPSPWANSHSSTEDTQGIDLGFSSLSIGGTVNSLEARLPSLSVSSLATFGDDQKPPGHSRVVSDGTGNLGITPPSPPSPLRSGRYSHVPMPGMTQSFSSEPGAHILGQYQHHHRRESQSHPSPIGTRSVLDVSGGGNNNIASSPASLIFDSSSLMERGANSICGTDSLFGSVQGRSQCQSSLGKGKLPPPPPTLEAVIDREYSRTSGGGAYGVGQDRGGPSNDSNQDLPGTGPFSILHRTDRSDRGVYGPHSSADGASPAVFSSSPNEPSSRSATGHTHGSLSRLISDSPRTTASAVVDSGAPGVGGKAYGRPPLSSFGSSSSSLGNRGSLPPSQDRLHDESSNRDRTPQHLPDPCHAPSHPGAIICRGRATSIGTAGFDEFGGQMSRQYLLYEHEGLPRTGYVDDSRIGVPAPASSHGGGAGVYLGSSLDSYVRHHVDEFYQGDRNHNIGTYHHLSRVPNQFHMQQQQSSVHQVPQQRFNPGLLQSDMSYHVRSYASGNESVMPAKMPPSHGSFGGYDFENGYGNISHRPYSMPQRQSLEGDSYDHQSGSPIYTGRPLPVAGLGGTIMSRSVSTGSNLRNASVDGRMNRAGSVPSHMAGVSLENSSQGIDRSSGLFGQPVTRHHRQDGASADHAAHSPYHEPQRGSYTILGGHEEAFGVNPGMHEHTEHFVTHGTHCVRESDGNPHSGIGHQSHGNEALGGTSVFLDERGRLSSTLGHRHHSDSFDINGMRLPQRGGGGSIPRPSSAGGHPPPRLTHRGGHSRGQSLETDLAGELIEDLRVIGVKGHMDAPRLDAAGEHITSVYAHLPPQHTSSPLSGVSGFSGPKVVYNVKFKRTQRSFVLGVRAPRDAVRVGAYVKVEADRGEDLGIVVGRMPAERYNIIGRFRPGGGVSSGDGLGGSDTIQNAGPTSSSSPGSVGSTVADLKRVLRLATHDEVSLLAVKRDEEDELLKVCRSKVRQRGLPMTVVDAEYQFDRHKLTFFFEAEGRIDFRELVRDLFSIYKTRIWMQQLDKNCASGSVSSGMGSPTIGVEGGATGSVGTIESEGSKELDGKEVVSKTNDEWNEKDLGLQT